MSGYFITNSNYESNVNYSIKAYYEYDLGDGNGIQYATDVTTYPTLSNLVSVTAIKAITNDTVKVGDEVSLRIDFKPNVKAFE